jgi:hypothetical protein
LWDVDPVERADGEAEILQQASFLGGNAQAFMGGKAMRLEEGLT